ncbi:MAG: hypothetical protein HQL58_09535 [Magnetococcales bacterium]|nr:hypothetical protein [Magnetococcales bacterium]
MGGTKPDKEQLLKALHALEKDPNSKEKLFGELGVTIVGGVLGAASAGSLAAAAGVTTITGLTAAASWLGITLVAATPVGWVAIAAAAGATLAYGLSKLIGGGASSEAEMRQMREHIKEKIADIERKEQASKVSKQDLTNFEIFLIKPIENDFISSEQARKLIEGVETGRIEISVAYKLVDNILASHKINDKQ